MNINKIIELGNEIVKPDYPWYSEFTWWVWIVTIGMFIIGALLIAWGIDDFGVFRPVVGSFMTVISLVILFGYVSMSDSKEDKTYKKEVNKWENEYVKPYIESLPSQKKEIVYIKIDAELSHKVEGSTWWGTGYTTSTEVQRTPLIVSYKDNGIVTKTNWFDTSMELTGEQKPFIEYKYLEKDIGHGIKKGIYNSKIYLPSSYTFTDIK